VRSLALDLRRIAMELPTADFVGYHELLDARQVCKARASPLISPPQHQVIGVWIPRAAW
jgi:hypothetical protein